MQEEVNQKTVALSIRTTKLTGKVLAAALGKVARALQKHHRKALTPQGRQSVKKLMNHYGGKSAIQHFGPCWPEAQKGVISWRQYKDM